jgi:diketogulonate reductase-like aldo/keto reductase
MERYVLTPLLPRHPRPTNPPPQYIIKHDLTRDPSPTWRAMEQLVKDGKTKSIGVSNWTIKDLEHLLSYASIPPAANQIEVHPFLPNTELLDYCIAHSIVPIAYSPLGSQDQVPGTNEKVSTNKDLLAIAQRNGITMAQLLIAWGIRRGYAVLPKSSNEERIKSNAKLVTLSDEDFEAVNKVSEGRCTRFVNMKNTFGYDVWPEEA